MQIITIFKKEYRQQGVLALAMLLLCFFVQLTAFIMVLFGEIGRDEPSFFAISLMMTALFAGSATAISFAGEHDEKTFGFLQSLPVTPMTVMLGKTVWLVCGTVAVFISSSLLSLIWGVVATSSFVSLTPYTVFGSVGFGIIEAFVWGLFWSPRCRSQISALLATYFCASAASYFSAFVCSTNVNIVESYCNAIPLRLGITAIVAIFAVRGTLKWFERAVQKNNQYAPSERLSRFRYPIQPQSPFFALLHQSVRQSSTILICGVVVMVYFCSTVMIVGLHSINLTNGDTGFFAVASLFGCFMFFVVFCGSIFAQDQKNNSFRFLSRCGISARNVWWSRILPFFIISLPCIAVWTRMLYFEGRYDPYGGYTEYRNVTGNLSPIISLFVAIWLVPFAVGAFISIYCRSMAVSIALTGAISAFIHGLMMAGILLCDLNPLWTTLPICVSLIIASRLRAADWLRERNTRKSRLIPLILFFVTIIVIFAAVPSVRIYSIPNPSLAEIEAVMNTTINFPEALSPEERKILFHETAASLDKPFTKKEWEEKRWYGYIPHPYEVFNKYPHKDNLSQRERAGEELNSIKKELATTPAFEVWLLNKYASRYRITKTAGTFLFSDDWITPFMVLYSCLPWEKERALRMLNDQLLFDVLQSTTFGNGRYYGHNYYYRVSTEWGGVTNGGLFDSNYFFWNEGVWRYQYDVSNLRARLVLLALECWYLDHDNTLPDSLDELVGTYLDKIPIEPLTGVVMKYIPKPDDKDKPRMSEHKRGWAYIKLGERPHDLHFLPGYKEDKETTVGNYY